MGDGKNAESDALLRRDIGFVGSAFLVFNGVVGAGIFALPGSLAREFGTFSPWLFPLFGGLVLLVALPLARLASYFRTSGGPVAYTAGFGLGVSFQTGWLYYVARVTALAANSNVFVAYAASIWPSLADGWLRAAVILALVGGITFVNVVGVKRAITALDALTVLKAAPLIALAGYGLVVAGGPVPATDFPLFSDVEVAALLVLYAFMGFENSLVPAGETSDAGRTVPRALILTLLLTVALYFVVQLSYVAIMPAGASGEAPLVALGTTLVGPAGGVVMILAALCSLAGNITGSMTSTPRVTFALAEQRALPAWFGKVSTRYATPANSVLFMGALGAVLALSGSFIWLAVVSTLARLFVYAFSLLALPSVRRRAGDRATLGTDLLLAAGIGVCVWAMFQAAWESWRMLLALVAIGTGLYGLARLKR